MKKIIGFLICFFMLCTPVFAQYEELDNIADDFSFSKKVEDTLEGKEIFSIKSLWESVKEEFIKETKNTVLSLMAVMGVVLLFSIITTMGQGLGGSSEKVSFFVLYSAVATVLLENFSENAEILQSLCDNLVLFLNAAIPVIGTAVVSSGNFGVYGGMYPVLIGAASLSANIIKSIGIPALMLSLGISVVGNLSDTFSISDIGKTIRNSALFIICGLLTIFSAAVGICGISAGGVNTVAMRGAKFVARSVIPVLGGLLSDSLDAVVSGALMLKNALGSVAVAGALTILIYPLIKVGAVIFVYKIAAALISPFCDRRISAVISDISGVLSCFIGFSAALGVLVIISFTTLLSAADMGVMLR